MKKKIKESYLTLNRQNNDGVLVRRYIEKNEMVKKWCEEGGKTLTLNTIKIKIKIKLQWAVL